MSALLHDMVALLWDSELIGKIKEKEFTIPVDMVSINAAKEGQALASDVDYRHYLHQWSCFPDQNDVIQARKAYDLQSDVSCCCGPWGGGWWLFPRKTAFHHFARSLLPMFRNAFPAWALPWDILLSLLITSLTSGLIQKVFIFIVSGTTRIFL